MSARFYERTLLWAHAFMSARFYERTLLRAHSFRSARFYKRTLLRAHAFMSARFVVKQLKVKIKGHYHEGYPKPRWRRSLYHSFWLMEWPRNGWLPHGWWKSLEDCKPRRLVEQWRPKQAWKRRSVIALGFDEKWQEGRSLIPSRWKGLLLNERKRD